jgi:hypothetical protein
MVATPKKNVPRGSVLDKNIRRVKFNKDIIIGGKFLNGKKIASDQGNMKNITKVKLARGG